MKPNIKRLQKLYDFMLTVPSERFNLRTWGTLDLNTKGSVSSDYVQYDDKVTSNMLKKFKCGTTACLLGWAASMPEFNKQGLTLRSDGLDGLNCYGKGEIELTVVYKYDKTNNSDESLYSFTAARKFFGLNKDTCCYLFNPETYNKKYRSKYYVLRRLKSVIKSGERKPNDITTNWFYA